MRVGRVSAVLSNPGGTEAGSGERQGAAQSQVKAESDRKRTKPATPAGCTRAVKTKGAVNFGRFCCVLRVMIVPLSQSTLPFTEIIDSSILRWQSSPAFFPHLAPSYEAEEQDRRASLVDR